MGKLGMNGETGGFDVNVSNNAGPVAERSQHTRRALRGLADSMEADVFWRAIITGLVLGTIGTAIGFALTPAELGSEKSLSASAVGASLGCLIGVLWLSWRTRSLVGEHVIDTVSRTGAKES